MPWLCVNTQTETDRHRQTRYKPLHSRRLTFVWKRRRVRKRKNLLCVLTGRKCKRRRRRRRPPCVYHRGPPSPGHVARSGEEQSGAAAVVIIASSSSSSNFGLCLLTEERLFSLSPFRLSMCVCVWAERWNALSRENGEKSGGDGGGWGAKFLQLFCTPFFFPDTHTRTHTHTDRQTDTLYLLAPCTPLASALPRVCVCLYIQSRAHQQQQQRCVSFLPAHTHKAGGLFCLASSAAAAAAVVVVLSSSRIGFKANKIWRPFFSIFFFFYSQLVRGVCVVCVHTTHYTHSSHLISKERRKAEKE